MSQAFCHTAKTFWTRFTYLDERAWVPAWCPALNVQFHLWKCWCMELFLLVQTGRTFVGEFWWWKLCQTLYMPWEHIEEGSQMWRLLGETCSDASSWYDTKLSTFVIGWVNIQIFGLLGMNNLCLGITLIIIILLIFACRNILLSTFVFGCPSL